MKKVSSVVFVFALCVFFLLNCNDSNVDTCMVDFVNDTEHLIIGNGIRIGEASFVGRFEPGENTYAITEGKGFETEIGIYSVETLDSSGIWIHQSGPWPELLKDQYSFCSLCSVYA